MTFEHFLELFNLAAYEAAVDKASVVTATSKEDEIRSSGLDSLDWSVAMMYMGDMFGISDEQMGDVQDLIVEGRTLSDLYGFVLEHKTKDMELEEAEAMIKADSAEDIA